jgi:hypothetical protein
MSNKVFKFDEWKKYVLLFILKRQSKIGEYISPHPKILQAKSGQGRSFQVISVQGRAGQGRAGQESGKPHTHPQPISPPKFFSILPY